MSVVKKMKHSNGAPIMLIKYMGREAMRRISRLMSSNSLYFLAFIFIVLAVMGMVRIISQSE